MHLCQYGSDGLHTCTCRTVPSVMAVEVSLQVWCKPEIWVGWLAAEESVLIYPDIRG